MATYSQTKSLLTVSSSLGADILLLAGFSGREELSRLFHYQLELLSENDAIAPKDVVGQPITWAVNHVDKAPRFFNGYVNRFAAGGRSSRGLRSYRAEVVPWLWFLTRTANCKIFQNKKADDIIKAVFDDLGFSDYKVTLNRTPTTRDYCVQYRETAFNFVSRLMEEEGIFYFFQHEDGKHTLALADAKSAYADCPEKEVEYFGGSLSPNHISAWEHQYEYRPGLWTQTDYNFETPSTSLMTSTSSVLTLPKISSYEVFDYPGLYAKTADGKPLTKARMEEEEAPYDVVAGASSCCTFTPAGKFTLTRHECEAEKKGYVLTGVQHYGRDPSHQNAGGTAEYSNSFTCIPDAVVYRPARITSKPVVQGPQTAVVVGKSGEEIYTDKYGRVKVQFFWDRLGKKDENSSCWIRVSHGWAGKNLGIMFTPRIGQEVIVDFLEGDPDRPVITGRVYNADMMPPWDLPAKQNRSGIRTLSTKGGVRETFNAIAFDDTKGSEELFITAQKDMNVYVENNAYLKVGYDDSKYCPDGSQKIEIWKDRTEIVHTGNETITIEKGDRTETVKKGNETITIEKGDRKVTVTKGSDTHDVGGNRTVTVGGDDKLTVSKGNQKVEITAGKTETKAAQSITLEVTPAMVKLEPSAITLSIGGSSIKLEPAAITLNMGPSTIKIDPTGVKIEGLMVKLDGSIMTDVKGLIANYKAGVMCSVAGAITMIG